MEKLVLLDINGLLCCKIKKNVEINKSSEILDLNSYKVILRPHYKEFLDFVYNNYKVGFFSSTCEWNAKEILNKLLNKEQKKLTVLMWFRDRTHIDPDSIDTYDTIKKLEDVFDNPVFNVKRKYHSGNTILIDDSKTKTRFNNPNNIIICESFTGNEDDCVLFELINLISDRYNNL
jgi:hypothetical protein